MQIEAKPGCVALATRILGNKWTPLLIKVLADGPQRFCELESKLGINPRTLTAKLRELEADAILTKQPITKDAVKYEYLLSKKGADLLPILQSMAEWGAKYSKNINNN